MYAYALTDITAQMYTELSHATALLRDDKKALGELRSCAHSSSSNAIMKAYGKRKDPNEKLFHALERIKHQLQLVEEYISRIREYFFAEGIIISVHSCKYRELGVRCNDKGIRDEIHRMRRAERQLTKSHVKGVLNSKNVIDSIRETLNG